MDVQLIKTNISSLIREHELDGKPCWVAPLILINVGVHNKLLYPPEELKKFPTAWDGRPVIINHPTKEGQPTTGNAPALMKTNIGQVFNTRFEDNKLKGEAWLLKDKMAENAPELVTRLEANEMIEVSTGLFLEMEKTSGKWEDKDYEAIARNHRPDHLAILLDDVGACSIEDGAGLPRLNVEEKQSLIARLVKSMSSFKKTLDGMLHPNEVSQGDIRDLLRTKLTELHLSAEFLFIEEVFDDKVVYEIEITTGKRQLLMRNYSFNQETNELTIDGAVTEVMRIVDFVPITNEKGEKMERAEAVGAMIANKDSKWDEGDKEFLTELSKETFVKLVQEPKEEKEPEVELEPKPKEESKEGSEVVLEKPEENKQAPKGLTYEELLAKAPQETQELIANGVEMIREKKNALVASLVSNAKCRFTEDQLKDMKVNELEMMAELGQVEVDHSLLGGGAPRHNANAHAAPEAPKVFANQRKEAGE